MPLVTCSWSMNRSVATCEDCAFIAAQQRGLPVPERLHPPTGDQPPLERVDVDTLVGVGGNVSVLVMAGDPRCRPRLPASPAAPERPSAAASNPQPPQGRGCQPRATAALSAAPSHRTGAAAVPSRAVTGGR